MCDVSCGMWPPGWGWGAAFRIGRNGVTRVAFSCGPAKATLLIMSGTSWEHFQATRQ